MPPVTRKNDKCTGHDACPPRVAVGGEATVTVAGIYIMPVDGISASMGSFVLRALAAGYTMPLPGGAHRIVVERVSVFVWDSFNFNKEDELGYWSCSKKDFDLSSFIHDESYHQVFNSNFNEFREKYGVGNDFMVLSAPKSIDFYRDFNMTRIYEHNTAVYSEKTPSFCRFSCGMCHAQLSATDTSCQTGFTVVPHAIFAIDSLCIYKRVVFISVYAVILGCRTYAVYPFLLLVATLWRTARMVFHTAARCGHQCMGRYGCAITEQIPSFSSSFLKILHCLAFLSINIPVFCSLSSFLLRSKRFFRRTPSSPGGLATCA